VYVCLSLHIFAYETTKHVTIPFYIEASSNKFDFILLLLKRNHAWLEGEIIFFLCNVVRRESTVRNTLYHMTETFGVLTWNPRHFIANLSLNFLLSNSVEAFLCLCTQRRVCIRLYASYTLPRCCTYFEQIWHDCRGLPCWGFRYFK
jgi:hypothetical protein